MCGHSHGVNKRFLLSPLKQRDIDSYSVRQPFRILYVSIVDIYKHQWHVVEAVARLRQSGLNVTLQLAGTAYPPALKRLHQATSHYVDQDEFIHYVGAVDYKSLPEVYHDADLFVFASSCENMPNILLEAMASGCPLVLSDIPAHRDILNESCAFFVDPSNIQQTADTISLAICNKGDAKDRALLAKQKTREWSIAEMAKNWERVYQDLL